MITSSSSRKAARNEIRPLGCKKNRQFAYPNLHIDLVVSCRFLLAEVRR
jgi:hypothetical protein